MNWIIITPIIAGIVAFWEQSKTIISKIRSLIFVTIDVDDNLASAVGYFCWKNMRRIHIGDLKYTSLKYYLKPYKRHSHIALECIDQLGTIFLYGKIPLIISTTKRNNDGTIRPNNDYGGAFSLTVIRGTINIDQLIIDSTEEYNKKLYSGFKTSRYYVQKSLGTLGDTKNGDQPECANVGTTSEEFFWHRRLLKWKYEDLGEPTKDSKNPFEFLDFPKEIHEDVAEIRNWLNSETWYKNKGIPWKRGWLMIGPPGTGKTSLARTIGEHLDIPIIIFALSTFTDKDFQKAWSNLQSYVPCIALIEDIDATFDGRINVANGSTMYGKPLSFDTLLNVIDGVQNSEGVFTIITSNCVEKLDTALGKPTNGNSMSTRPGRIDKIVSLGLMKESERQRMAERILCDCPQFIESLVKDCDNYTPAQFQDKCSKVALKMYWENKEGETNV